MRIEEEIDQAIFPNEHVKAHINLIFTAGWAQLKTVKELKPFNISIQQFNILRILRGRDPKPASIRELTDRMLDKSSNASRLVDKLVVKDLVVKHTCPGDNRRLEVMITPKGKELLEKASKKMDDTLKKLYKNLSETDTKQLNLILDKLRD